MNKNNGGTHLNNEDSELTGELLNILNNKIALARKFFDDSTQLLEEVEWHEYEMEIQERVKARLNKRTE